MLRRDTSEKDRPWCTEAHAADERECAERVLAAPTPLLRSASLRHPATPTHPAAPTAEDAASGCKEARGRLCAHGRDAHSAAAHGLDRGKHEPRSHARQSGASGTSGRQSAGGGWQQPRGKRKRRGVACGRSGVTRERGRATTPWRAHATDRKSVV